MRAGALPDITPARPDGDASGLVVAPDNTHQVKEPQGSEGEDRAAKLARLELVRPGISTAATLAHERTLPVVDGLSQLVPRGGLQRGSVVAANGPGATSFSLAMVAAAARQGSFLAIVAPRSFALASCLDFDIPLRRVVQFVLPARAGGEGANWAQLVAAVIEGFDLVMLADRRRVTASQARQLTNRVRERGTVVVRAGGPAWADGADLRYDLHEPKWQGLGAGHGHLRSRVLRVQVAGRRWQGAERVHHLALPAQGAQSEQTALVLPAAPAPTVVPFPGSPDVAGSPEPTVIVGSYQSVRHAGSDIDHLIAADQADAESAPGQPATGTHGATA